MGGKGQRRREKNYRAAHEGSSRLPPPPKPSSVDALPSKLRRLMAFTQPGSEREALGDNRQKKSRGSDGGGSIGEFDKKPNAEHEKDLDIAEIEREENGDNLVLLNTNHNGNIVQDSSQDKKKRKRKRKRKEVDDLRFGTAEELGLTGSKRKERKKKRWEERKKKHKRKKVEENVDFPGREKIKFGDVVKAPPKLVVIPKASKTVQHASQERLRLQAVEAYRNRRGWTSRPGTQLPPPMTTPSSL